MFCQDEAVVESLAADASLRRLGIFNAALPGFDESDVSCHRPTDEQLNAERVALRAEERNDRRYRRLVAMPAAKFWKREQQATAGELHVDVADCIFAAAIYRRREMATLDEQVAELAARCSARDAGRVQAASVVIVQTFAIYLLGSTRPHAIAADR